MYLYKHTNQTANKTIEYPCARTDTTSRTYMHKYITTCINLRTTWVSLMCYANQQNTCINKHIKTHESSLGGITQWQCSAAVAAITLL